MSAIKVLQSAGLKSNDIVFSLDNEEVMKKILEFTEKWELRIQVEKISKKDWQALFASYADAVVDYHPENDHQERGMFLRNEQMLKKYGLTDKDIQQLDFC